MKKALIIFLFFCFYQIIHANGNKDTSKEMKTKTSTINMIIDSLKLELQSSKIDTNKINLLIKLSSYLSNIDNIKGIEYGNEALHLAEKIKWFKGIVNSYSVIGINYDRQGNQDIAIENYKKCINFCLSNNREDDAVGVYNNIAASYNFVGDYLLALENYQKALKINEKLNNQKWLAHNLSGMGDVFNYLKEYDKSIEYYSKAIEIYKIINELDGRAVVLANLGKVYNETANYDKAEEVFNNSLEIFKKVDNLFGQQFIINSLATLNKNRYKFNRAYQLYKEAIILNDKIGRSISNGSVYGLLGELFYSITKDSILHNKSSEFGDLELDKNVNFQKAYEYTLESINLSESINSKRQLVTFYKTMSDILTDLQNFKDANAYLLKHLNLKDSIMNTDKLKEIENLESKRNLEIQKSKNQILQQKSKNQELEIIRKNQSMLLLSKDREIQNLDRIRDRAEIKNQEQELEKAKIDRKLQQSQINYLDEKQKKQEAKLDAQNQQRNFYLLGILLFMSMFLVAFIRFREKKKLSEQLSLQKTEIESQKSLIEEKNNEIVDSINYAATIQNALLPWSSVLNKNFKEHFVIYKPKDIVSGDSYWFQEVDGVKYLAVIDCTGHGVPGSMLTVIANSVLDDAVLSKKITSTGEILSYMNEKVTEVLNQRLSENSIRDGMEVALIAIHKDKIQFSGAGRPLYVRNGKIEIIKSDKRGIAGQNDNYKYYYLSVEIEKQDNMMIYLSSDGFADQMNENSKKYASKRFVETLERISAMPLNQQKDILEDEFKSHKGNREQIDDVTVIGLKI